MTKRVRAMLQSDIDTVYAVELAAHRAPWSSDILSDCVLVGYDCRILEIDNGKGFEIASYIISRYNDTSCHVLNLCVAPALQGKGHGPCLLQHVIDSPARSVVDTIILEVRPSNQHALHVYQKMGFEQVATKRDYYRDDNGVEDAVVLQKKIQTSRSQLDTSG